MDTMEHATRKKVRQHPAALRQQVLMQCSQPGASVARVALAHGLNANLVHAWRQQERIAPVAPGAGTPAPAPAPPAQFIALQMPASAPAALPNIHIELRRGAATVSVTWPCQAASECGAWLREWLR
jgi:transposase